MTKRATMDCSIEQILWALGIPEGVVLETAGVPRPSSGIGKTLRLHLVGDGLPEAYRVTEGGAVRNMPTPAPSECNSGPAPDQEIPMGEHGKLRAAIAALDKAQRADAATKQAVEKAYGIYVEKAATLASILETDYGDSMVVIDGRGFERVNNNCISCTTEHVPVFIPGDDEQKHTTAG